MLKKILSASPIKALKCDIAEMGVLSIVWFTIVKQCMYERRK